MIISPICDRPRGPRSGCRRALRSRAGDGRLGEYNQLGTRASVALHGEQLRSLLAVMVLSVCAILGYRLFATPADLFTLVPMVGG